MNYKLSILIHSKSSDRPEVNALTMELQEQLNHLDSKYAKVEIEAMFWIGDTKTELKRKKWLLARTTGHYFTEIQAPFLITKSYLFMLWFFLIEHENDEEKLKTKGIYKRQPYMIPPTKIA